MVTAAMWPFNDHEGSTKSYAHSREHIVEVVHADFVPLMDPIDQDYTPIAMPPMRQFAITSARAK